MNLHQKFLSQLPDDWDQVSIERLGSICAGGTPSRNEPNFWDGTIAWVTPSELTALKSKWLAKTEEYITEKGLARSGAKLLPERTLLITTRATIGNIAIAAIPVCTNQGFKNIVPNEFTNPDFYYYLLQEIVPEFYRLASGSTFLEISRRDFVSIIVPRPETDEQRRIAEVLDTVDAAIKRTDTLINKLKWMKAGLLNDLLTRGLDRDGTLRDPVRHPEQFKDSRIGLIPKEWDVVPLNQEINIVHGYAFSGKYFSNSLPGEVLLVPGNFHRDGGLYFDRSNTKYYQGEYLTSTVLSNGDLLIVMTDLSPRTLILGRVAELQASFKVLHNQRLGKIVVKQEGEWNNHFLMASMNSERVRRNIIITATGTTVRHTSPDRILSNNISKPSVGEQNRITEIITTQDARIRTEESYRNKLFQIKKGLMHDLLTGRVRVPATKSEVVAV